MPIIDGSLVTASGPGLGQVEAHKQTLFNVQTNGAGGEADLLVSITGMSMSKHFNDILMSNDM